MEETNYDRKPIAATTKGPGASVEPKVERMDEKDAVEDEGSPDDAPVEAGTTTYKKKSYLEKLSLKDNFALKVFWGKILPQKCKKGAIFSWPLFQ